MTLANTPIRLLVKTYANGLLNREQHLLRKLATQGHLTQDDLQNFLNIHIETGGNPTTVKRYSISDWVIMILGLCAAAALGIILYS